MSGTLRPLVLATDLDGTFAGGSDRERHALYGRLRERDRCHLIYVTGRTVESARALQEVLHLPRPELFITDVGAAVSAGAPGEQISFPEHVLADRWPGADAVVERLVSLDRLVYRQPWGADRRVSYFVRDGVTFAEALRRVAEAVEGLDVEVVGSVDTFVDILPGGTDKGTTLLRVLDWLRADREWVVVAGDSLNDAGLFRTGLAGIVVGNAEKGLKDMVRGRDNVYVAEASGAAGVLEGLQGLGLLGQVVVS